MKRLTLSLGSLLSVLLVHSTSWAGIVDELSATELRKIRAGEQVFKTEDVPRAPWPKAFLYQKINSTPEEAIAVFFDFELQSTYIPSLRTSKIAQVIDARTYLVDYVIAVPLVADEWYQVKDWVASYQNTDGEQCYRLDWTLIKARTTKHSEGHARFEAFEGGTLLAYYNYVVPGAGLPNLAKEQAMKQVRVTGQSLSKKIEDIKRNDSALLNWQLQRLRNALVD